MDNTHNKLQAGWYKGGVARNYVRHHLNLQAENVVDIDYMENLQWDLNVDRTAADLVGSFLNTRDCTLNQCVLQVTVDGEEILHYTPACEEALKTRTVVVTQRTMRAVCRGIRLAAAMAGQLVLDFDLNDIEYCCARCEDEPAHQLTKAYLQGIEQEYLLRLEKVLPKAAPYLYLFPWGEVEKEFIRRDTLDLLWTEQERLLEIKTFKKVKISKGAGKKYKTKK